MKTKEIAEFLSAELVGDPDIEVKGVASLDAAVAGELSFLSSLIDLSTEASVIIVPRAFDRATNAALIISDNPKLAFARIAKKFNEHEQRYFGNGPTFITESADVCAIEIGAFVTIGENSCVPEGCRIADGVRIGRNVTIGKYTTIHPNVIIYDNAKIGRNCVIHAGTVIGSDGFGYVKDDNGEHLQFPQIGSIVIEDYVEIGANCCIDRGSLGETRIGEGTKIDNLVHIAHNVRIGKRVLIAGQSGIAGSSVLEDDVVIAGQVGISDHVTIKTGAIIGAKSAVFPNKIVRAGFWAGIPVQRIDDYTKQTVLMRNLEKMQEDLLELKNSKLES